MPEQVKKTPCCTALLAHVDAGKTTLSEALLYLSGARRVLGRVDHRDAFLDTHSLERARGITIFSKQARLSTDTLEVTLVDTPGHGDFSAEMERTLPVLDCAILVISGTDGIQAHTLTLWRLLERYRVPTILFINKMDLAGADREKLMARLREELSPGCADAADPEVLAEAAALCDEALLENYLQGGAITDANLRGLVEERQLFPCLFGSALKLQGIRELLEALERFAPRRSWPGEFAARVYKITRDPQGNRLTWLRITGGALRVRSPLEYRDRKGHLLQEKPVQLRLYSGEKFTAPEQLEAGALCAVTGLTGTWIGQGLGAEPDGSLPLLEPVMTYRIVLPRGCDPMTALSKLRQLEEEDPMLRILWSDSLKQLQVQLMGRIQLEVLQSVVLQRFGLEITLEDPRIFYKETIAAPVEGVGHYEPLRHYAEVHLLLEPLPRGSGLVFDTVCSPDVLEAPYQHLVLGHLSEKLHLGVLTGSPITDMKITLLVGRAHQKHTEGGDFRQATYRAVRQGLMEAQSVLLEPLYAFILTLPTEQVGRAITDIRAMGGEFRPPEATGTVSTLRGTVPAAELGDYAAQVAAYTQGRGLLQLSLEGYAPCHNTDKVRAALAYDPLADLDNPPGSIFCAHGAGFHVPWDQVKSYMHLESPLKKPQPSLITQNLRPDDRTLEAIMEREFGPIKRPQYSRTGYAPAEEKLTLPPLRQQYLIVDGYNILFAWDTLAETAKTDLDAARRGLLDALSSYTAFKKCRTVVVFDGYKRPGPGSREQEGPLQVVYTAQGETADGYIEALVAQIGANYNLRVATSDSLVQLSSLRSGVLRMSARELFLEVEAAREEMKKYF